MAEPVRVRGFLRSLLFAHGRIREAMMAPCSHRVDIPCGPTKEEARYDVKRAASKDRPSLS